MKVLPRRSLEHFLEHCPTRLSAHTLRSQSFSETLRLARRLTVGTLRVMCWAEPINPRPEIPGSGPVHPRQTSVARRKRGFESRRAGQHVASRVTLTVNKRRVSRFFATVLFLRSSSLDIFHCIEGDRRGQRTKLVNFSDVSSCLWLPVFSISPTLANRRIRPLCHLSGWSAASARLPAG